MPISIMNERPEIAELLKRQRGAPATSGRGSPFEEKIEIIERMRKLQLNRSLMPKPRLKGKDEGVKMKTCIGVLCFVGVIIPAHLT